MPPPPTSSIRDNVPSFQKSHLHSSEYLSKIRALSAPHVESFNYFLEEGLSRAIKDIEPIEVDVADPKARKRDESIDGLDTEVKSDVDSIKFWFENVKVAPPMKMTESGIKKLHPRECREMGVTYDGTMSGDFCYQIISRNKTKNGATEVVEGRVMRMQRRFGDVPIMVMSKACHLHNKKPKDLVRLREEQSEFGGYFIIRGNERCVRLLQIPRRNHPSAIQRASYRNRGNTYTDLGVAIRCSRHNEDQSSITNTLHYLTTGGATLKFMVRKQEFLVPVVLVLRALGVEGGRKLDGSVDYFEEEEDMSEDDDSGEEKKREKIRTGRTTRCFTDEEIYRRVVQGDETNTFLKARAELLLQDARKFSQSTPVECLAYLGSRFRPLSNKPDSRSDVEVGHYMIQRFILVHLPSYTSKQEILLLMLRKLYAFAAGDCGVDNADSLQNHEILLPGHLINTMVKEKFEEALMAIRLQLYKDMRTDYTKLISNLQKELYWGRVVDRSVALGSGGIGKKVAAFLSTGNVVSSSGLDLMQVSGFTIVAERLNWLRYCAHYRSVHRGQFFMEMKTTSVRKLLPDQWGFLCPVHTPDGGPCGLLSHLALKCSILSAPARVESDMVDLDELLISLGVVPCGVGGADGDGRCASTHLHLPVCLDGRVVGGASSKACRLIATRLRCLKVEEKPTVPPSLEVAFIPPGIVGGPYPGLYLFTSAARLIRPVLHRSTGRTELIGPMEQPFLDIACLPQDIREGITTHQELDPTNMLSLISSLTPFSDYNQSPRNMYQCQMGKQTMGTPAHSLPHRTDNKLYRLQNPQAPVVQTSRHGEYKMDEYPNGTNAVVAVLSYTGFDMEDAMILNKSSYERGFGHASVYKTMKVDLKEEADRRGSSSKGGEKARMRFGNKSIRKYGTGAGAGASSKGGGVTEGFLYPNIGEDGLPEVGTWVKEGDPLYCIIDELTGADWAAKHKEKERACVQTVRLLGGSSASGPRQKTSSSQQDQKVCITLRIPRNPVIGDKFSSRHGQKGVLSILWPQEDMPFSESGISPDVIINPHAFPSRMTIGMLIESMAGKSGAMHGLFQDATPFSFHETGDKLAIDYFGEQLQAAGYNYYGSEPLYSGVSGCLMHADLYIGVVFYQRLRHMVSDKYQVRATGAVNQLTRQPIKGRKKGGGIRLGEMERDSLLSHGTAFLLHDRLLNCSDRHISYACTRCGDLLSPTTERSTVLSAGQSVADATAKARLRVYCRNSACRNSAAREGANDDCVEPIVLPYVYRYLANELAGMNIKMTLDIK